MVNRIFTSILIGHNHPRKSVAFDQVLTEARPERIHNQFRRLLFAHFVKPSRKDYIQCAGSEFPAGAIGATEFFRSAQ